MEIRDLVKTEGFGLTKQGENYCLKGDPQSKQILYKLLENAETLRGTLQPRENPTERGMAWQYGFWGTDLAYNIHLPRGKVWEVQNQCQEGRGILLDKVDKGAIWFYPQASVSTQGTHQTTRGILGNLVVNITNGDSRRGSWGPHSEVLLSKDITHIQMLQLWNAVSGETNPARTEDWLQYWSGSPNTGGSFVVNGLGDPALASHEEA